MPDAKGHGDRGPFIVAAARTTIVLSEPTPMPADPFFETVRLRHGLAVIAAPCVLFWAALVAVLALIV